MDLGLQSRAERCMNTVTDKLMLGWQWLRRFGPKLGPYVFLELVMPGGTLLALILFLHRRGYAGLVSPARRLRAAARRVIQICFEPGRAGGLKTTGVCPWKYLCLVYLDEKNLHSVADSECKACGEALRQSGHHIAAEALASVDTATTVRVRNGKVSVTDGPFTETKEQLAGFYPHRCEGSERGDLACGEDSAGARGQHRGASGARAVGAVEPRLDAARSGGNRGSSHTRLADRQVDQRGRQRQRDVRVPHPLVIAELARTPDRRATRRGSRRSGATAASGRTAWRGSARRTACRPGRPWAARWPAR